MKWLRGRKDPEDNMRHDTAVEERRDEAEAALRETKKTTRKVEEQLDVIDRLREGWARVHERNNLAELFLEEYRRKHG